METRSENVVPERKPPAASGRESKAINFRMIESFVLKLGSAVGPDEITKKFEEMRSEILSITPLKVFFTSF
jgi:hypothetical protein